jgi:hypothetical protein
MFHELTPHAPPLRSLSAHDKGDPRRLLSPRRKTTPDLRSAGVLPVGTEFLNSLR